MPKNEKTVAPCAMLFGNGTAAFFDAEDKQIGSMQSHGWKGLHLFVEKYPDAPIYIQMADPLLKDLVPHFLANIKKPEVTVVNPIPDEVKDHFDKKYHDNLINEVTKELRHNELKVLDEFAKAFICSESLSTGKSFIGILKDFRLNIQQVFDDGKAVTRYWFTLKEEL